MSKPFEEWIKEGNKITHELRIPIKNGIKYQVFLTTTQKPKKKRFKTIKQKKWQVKGLFLISFEIVNEKLIAQIIKNDANEQAKYDKALAVSILETYNILFSDTQYKKFTNFLKTNDIQLEQEFYIQRKGLLFKTRYEFTVD